MGAKRRVTEVSGASGTDVAANPAIDSDQGSETLDSAPPVDLLADEESTSEARRERRVVRSRRRWVWIGTFAALLAMLGLGWWLGAQSESPEQAAARAEPPAASWITVGVERRVLTATVIQRGDVKPEASLMIGVPSSVEGDPVVTQVDVAAGDEVAEGVKVVEVSGRPVFVMMGSVPVYRSLKPSMEGADVKQLQEALVRLGYPMEIDGVYGAQTKAAVKSFYEAAGYDPVPASETSEVDVSSAAQAVSDAKRGVASAEDALNVAKTDNGEGVDAQAVTQAQRDLDAAKEQLASAQRTLDAANAAGGAMVPQGEIVFLPAFPARVLEAQATVGPIGAAVDDGAGEGGGGAKSVAAVELAVGRLVVTTSVSPADAGLLRNGMTVQLLDESTSVEYPAEITQLGTEPVADANGQLGFPAVLVPTEPLPDTLTGVNLRVTATTASTDTEVLVVPIAAVSSAPDGTTRVTVVTGPNDPAPVDVTVRAGLSADGFIAVEPVDDGALDVGSLVVVGR